ncbi:MAG: transcriptional repressor [SAR202 cluster bacterium]|nr:transcriptional repressor [SAR202 cluster bacterium]
MARIRGAGHRMTAQREAVVRALVNSERHPSAEELFTSVRAEHSGLSLATVYKTLDVLKALGEVLELEFRDGAMPGNRYDGVRPHAHPHLVCVSCGTIEDLETDPLAGQAQAMAESRGYRVERYRFDLYGLCPTCQARARACGHTR